MPGQKRRFHVGEVGEGLEHPAELGPHDPATRSWLGGENPAPVGDVVDAVKDLRRFGTEQIDQGRIELCLSVLLRDPSSRLCPVTPTEHLERTGQLDKLCRQADFLGAQPERMALAVPLLICLPDAHAYRVVQTNPLRQLRSQRRVCCQPSCPYLLTREGKRREPLGALRAAAVRADPSQEERE